MKRFSLILACGLLLNAFQYYRFKNAAGGHPPSRQPSEAVQIAEPVRVPVPTPEEAKTVAALLARVTASGAGAAANRRLVLEEADKLPDAAYLVFARAVAQASGDPYAQRESTLESVFIRFAERNALMAFDWLLTEEALYAGEWSLPGMKVFAWWATRDAVTAFRWMQAARHRTGLKDKAAQWLQAACGSCGAAIAGTMPAEAAALMLEKAPLGVAMPQNEEFLSMSLKTADQRAAFIAAVIQAGNAGADASRRDDVLNEVLRVIGKTGGTLGEYLSAWASLPGDPAWRIRSIDLSFRHFGEEPAFIEWALAHCGSKEWLGGFAANWAKRDMESVTAWLMHHPPGSLRDEAIQGMLSPIKELDPESALAWAVEVTDPANRDSLLRQIYDSWAVAAPEQADAAFKAKGLPLPAR